MKSLLVNMKTQQKQKISDSTKGMSSSLLGTLQTDWITGRSLETVVFCFAAIVEAFAAAWGLRDSPESGRDDSKNEREWKRQDKRIPTLTQPSALATVKVILFSLHLNLFVGTVALLAPTQARRRTRKRMHRASRISATWNFERNSLYITNGTGILLQHLWLNTSVALREREEIQQVHAAANWES